MRKLIIIATFPVLAAIPFAGMISAREPAPPPPTSLAQQPGYIIAVDLRRTDAGRDVGYVRQADVLAPRSVPVRWVVVDGQRIPRPDVPDAVAVYGKDLRTIVGHMVRNVGFVPMGSDPSTMPPVMRSDESTSDSVPETN